MISTLEERLSYFANKNVPVRIMVIGLGSVGSYLLDYLCSSGDPAIEIIAAGRNEEKMLPAANIARISSMIRGQNRSRVIIDGSCDLDHVETIASCIARHRPHFIVNTSRAFPGVKYGSISWHTIRAYGIWTPLAVRYAKAVMQAVELAGSSAIVINTSYSDAVIPWLKEAGLSYPDFGSGNLNHLIPRIKYAASEILGLSDPWELEVLLATGHFHDVVISKEGHDEGVKQLLTIRYHGKILNMNQSEIWKRCKIPMPSNAMRNMMNASSNFEIISGILYALRSKCRIRLHSPGAFGELGGYPVMVDAAGGHIRTFIDESDFSLEQMREKNRLSMNLDGIERIEGDCLYYTENLVNKVQDVFHVVIPRKIALSDADQAADFLIKNLIAER